ncbi:hypothetical protein BpHYR1_043465 [Brachionus plicatilis]|uniref:Uncharacterized protein n=1 Tax=Brachionus plicatilis TaxID=10195 RepID=A0A3M7T714_BRAPC|nr:hypothetical protein BpHYR1_043465 [Brachionus plicatilis]
MRNHEFLFSKRRASIKEEWKEHGNKRKASEPFNYTRVLIQYLHLFHLSKIILLTYFSVIIYRN